MCKQMFLVRTRNVLSIFVYMSALCAFNCGFITSVVQCQWHWPRWTMKWADPCTKREKVNVEFVKTQLIHWGKSLKDASETKSGFYVRLLPPVFFFVFFLAHTRGKFSLNSTIPIFESCEVTLQEFKLKGVFSLHVSNFTGCKQEHQPQTVQQQVNGFILSGVSCSPARQNVTW